VVEEKSCVKHVRFRDPILVKMNGRRNEGVILKPTFRPPGAAPRR
jgi:hypothetical protein